MIKAASEPRDRPDMEGEISRCLAFSFRRRLFEQVALGVREDRSRFGSRSLAAEHRQPCHPPGDDAAKRNAVGHPRTHLADFNGILQADAHTGFRQLCEPGPDGVARVARRRAGPT